MPAGLERTGDIHPHERTVARAQQESVVDEFGQDGTAQRGFQRPQPPSLRLSQPQAWHLQEFPSYAVDDVFAETSSTAYEGDRKSTRLNSSHTIISYAVFC